MRKIFIILSGVVLISILSFKINDNPHGDNPIYQIGDSVKMDANNISTWFRNNGGFNRHPVTGNSGFEWPKGSNKFARYASGLWIGAMVNGNIRVALAEYDYEYLPGYIDDEGNPQGKNDPAYSIYKINSGDSTSPDYLNWPFSQGAYADPRGKPYLIGSQTMFYSYTDGYPESHEGNAGSTLPLKAQILQTNWCFVNSYKFLDDVIFTEYRIINRGDTPWVDCYFAQWTDDDLGNPGDDAAGCDTNLNLGFTYNYGSIDPVYGIPPAVGFLYLRGFSVGSVGDTLKYFDPPGSNNLLIKPNQKDMGMTAFNLTTNDADPRNYFETYLILQGRKYNGTLWYNPITNDSTTFAYSGDPESGTGWLYTSGADQRFLQCSGPVLVNPGDTQTVITAQIISRGTTNKTSVSRLKQTARSTQKFFDSNFDVSVTPPSPKVSSYAPGNGKVFLSWNDSCERVTFQNKLSGDIYKFQGYNIYQIRPNNLSPSADDTVLIKTFDIIDGIREIRDSVYINEYGDIFYGIVQKGSDNGISRFIVLDKDTLSDREFINGTEYKFSVTAYYYDPMGGIFTIPKVLRSPIEKNILRVIPQDLAPGTQVNYKPGDTISTNQKDLGVMPIIIDPLKLVTAGYTLSYVNYMGDTAYNLDKTVNGSTSRILENIENIGNQDTARIVDGFLLANQIVSDSGVVKDPDDPFIENTYSNMKAWTYDPPANQWVEGPDTTAVYSAKMFGPRQFQSRSIGMTFPTLGTFRNNKTKIFAHGKFLAPGTGSNATLTGGPLRKIQIVFGQSSMAYRYDAAVNVLSSDTNLSTTPFAGMTNVPFSVFSVDELDSTNGAPRQLNVAFIDADNNGVWDPDTSKLGKYQITYILSSTYSQDPSPVYTTKNPGPSAPTIGFPAFDIMYAWVPRVKKSSLGLPMNFTNGDKLTVSPYRITRPDFVPGYPVKYSWIVNGSSVNNSATTAADIEKIKVFPNPYYGTSELEYDSGGEKFIYFSHLPLQCNIYIYTLDGVMIKRIERNQSDPTNTLEKWDLKNSEGTKAASGMYIVYVDCKDLGTKTLKIAVFTAK